jgi:hypothetical protein
LEPNSSCDNEEQDDDASSLRRKGGIVFHVIGKKKIACSNFVEILVVSIESKKIIDEIKLMTKSKQKLLRIFIVLAMI